MPDLISSSPDGRFEFDLFLSHAERDRERADALWQLLRVDFSFRVFHPRDQLPKRGSDDWVAAVHSGVRSSRCIVPVVTRSSIDRLWLAYELGCADILGRSCCRVRSADISPSHIDRLQPGSKHRYTYLAADLDDLVDLVVRLHELCELDRPAEADVRARLEGNERARAVLRAFRKRSVFIAGSWPSGGVVGEPVRIEEHPELRDQAALEFVVRDVTAGLLELGFTVCCYPFVSCAPRAAVQAIEHWCGDRGVDWRERFDIASSEGPAIETGESLGESLGEARSSAAIDMIMSAFRHHRTKVIQRQEVVIAFGGNEKTRIECQIAKNERMVRLLPIPMFGGAALEFAKDLDHLPIRPEDRVWDAAVCRAVVDFVERDWSPPELGR